MDDLAYIFPKDLRVSGSGISRVLMIGSCQTAQIHSFLKHAYPDISFEYIVSNYVGDLPPADLTRRYDTALIQFPLRSIITDHVIWFNRMNDAAFCERVCQTAQETLKAMYDAAINYSSRVSGLTFVSNFMIPQQATSVALDERGTTADLARIVSLINEYLFDLVSRDSECLILDVNRLASIVGKRYILDDDISFYGHNALKISNWSSLEPPGLALQPIPALSDFYPSKADIFARIIFEQMEHDFRVDRQIDQVKVVVFDLDNTLWRGQISEHYRDDAEEWPKSDTWPMGIWEAVHHLRARGILVSICSKNDHALVAKNWNRTISPAFLQLSDFISPKINWRPKTDNIAEIISELNVKATSVVFVDDNPVEREVVSSHLTGIRTIGENPFLVRRTLLWSSETQLRSITVESRQREDMVRRQIKRETDRTKFDRSEFLGGLNTTLTFLEEKGLEAQRVRVLELINKTNQFNTTGQRWDARALAGYADAVGHIFAFRVSDKYADYGLVGVILATDQSIDQFVMSCRVMGMDIEIAALAHVVDALRSRNGRMAVHALIRLTPDNTPCRTVFERAGFVLDAERGEDRYFKLAEGQQRAAAPHVKLLLSVRVDETVGHKLVCSAT